MEEGKESGRNKPRYGVSHRARARVSWAGGLDVRLRALQLGLGLVRLGPVVILLLLVSVMALLTPYFLTERNIQNIFTQTSVIAILAIGQLLVIVSRGIDLSVGAVLGLSTVVGALAYEGSLHAGAAVIVVMLGLGTGIGLLNGLIYVYGRLPNSIINTLAMLYAAQGIALILSHGNTIEGMPTSVDTLGRGFVGIVPVSAILVGGVAAFAVLFTRKMKWGRWIYAVGGNSEAASRVGIPVRRVLVSVFAISGLCAGLAGIVTAGQTSAGYGLAGQFSELDSIAAVIIGGASFLGGRGTVTSSLVGAFIIGCLRNGLDLLGVYPTWQLVAVGGVTLLAVLLEVLRTYLERRFRVAQAIIQDAGSTPGTWNSLRAQTATAEAEGVR
jgi:ribose transport system permease protein